MAQQAVENYHWLKPDEMLVGLGFAETTPGPLISVVQFVGFMAAFRHSGALDPVLAGTLGGILAMWATFVPSFLWIFLGAPLHRGIAGQQGAECRLVCDYCRRGWGHPQSRDLVRPSHAVRPDRAELARLGASEIRARLLEAGLRFENEGENVVVPALKAAKLAERIILQTRQSGMTCMRSAPPPRGPKVCKLAAGGNRIRTVGPALGRVAPIPGRFLVSESQVRRRLAAGGSWIRTLGPPVNGAALSRYG